MTLLCLAPVALLLAVFPGRGHDFFRSWLAKLAGYLARKVIYSLILAIVLAVCQALDDATSNLGWLLAFVLQAAFLWTVFIQRDRLTRDLLAATAGPGAAQEGDRQAPDPLLRHPPHPNGEATPQAAAPNPRRNESNVLLGDMGGSSPSTSDPDPGPAETPEEEPA